MTLNGRQQKFVDEYILSGNAEQSAIKAGYSEKYARGCSYKLLAHIGIKEAIEERTKEIKSNNIMTAKERMEFLSELIQNKNTRPSDAIKALDTLNKMDATYITQINMTSKQDVTVNNPLKDLSTNDIKKLIDAYEDK